MILKEVGKRRVFEPIACRFVGLLTEGPSSNAAETPRRFCTSKLQWISWRNMVQPSGENRLSESTSSSIFLSSLCTISTYG